MTITTFPNLAPTNEPGTNNPFFDMISKAGKVYTDSMQVNGEQLWMSSARIIQEHTMSTMMNASQACMEALAQNAAASQELSLARIGSANQKTLEIMTSVFNSVMTTGLKPAT